MPVIKGAPEPSEADLSLQAEQGARRIGETPVERLRSRVARKARGRRGATEPGAVEQIGVVFVHGIGAQEPGETLLDWSAPIVRTIRDWHQQHDLALDPVRRAQIDFQGSTTPIVRLTVAAATVSGQDHPAQEWVLSEAWWATDVDPPGAKLMLGWLFEHREFTRIVTGVFNGLADSGEAGWWVQLERLLVRAFVVPLTILAPIVYAVSSLLKLIPIKLLQDGLARQQLDWFLIDWFGDVRVLVADRVQAANIRAKLARTIRALEALGCTRIVVVGHSGGAIVSYMTLTDPLYLPGSGDDDLSVRVDRLITLGQGLDLAWLLGHADAGGDEPGDDRLAPGDHLMQRLNDKRPKLEWTDFWATHDPAPAGPIGGTTARPSFAVSEPKFSVPVFNRMSIRNDHGGYWDNDEQFVLPVVRLIETAGTPTTSRFYPFAAPDVRATRRRGRVRSLAEWWSRLLVSGAAVLAVGAGAWWAGAHVLERLGRAATELALLVTNLDAVAREYDSPADYLAPIAGAVPAIDLDVARWLQVVGPNVVGAAVVIIVIWLLGKPGVAGWNRWDEAARIGARRDDPCVAPSGSFDFLAGLTVGLLWILVIAAALGALADLERLPRLVGV